jgi:RNA polymerase sigma-70 factor (ECF subfamily)
VSQTLPFARRSGCAEDALEDREPPAEDVADLVGRLRAGERSALAEVYDRHHGALRAFARRLLADHDAAEDLVHDVFLALPKALRRFEGRSSLRTFLVSVAINHCRHHVRAAARYRRATARYARERDAEPAPAPSSRTERREMAELLVRGLDALPFEQRVAFVLCVVEEHPSAAAARIAGVNENTIRTRVMRAKRKLRAFLEREEAR